MEFCCPLVIFVFHDTTNKINLHNGFCHQMLCLAQTWKTKRWDMRVNITTLAMTVINSFFVATKATKSKEWVQGQDFFLSLAIDSIDNERDVSCQMDRALQQQQHKTRNVEEEEEEEEDTPVAANGVGLHLTPLKEKNGKGFMAQHCCVGNCRKK